MTETTRAPASGTGPRSVRRRRFLRGALGGLVVAATAAAAGFELVSHGVLPGQSELAQLDGACSVPAPDFTPYAAPGPQVSGSFYSAARRTTVGYTIGYPPGHRPGDRLPLVVALHGYGGTHRDALSGLSPAQAVALTYGGAALAPAAWSRWTGAAATGIPTRATTRRPC